MQEEVQQVQQLEVLMITLQKTWGQALGQVLAQAVTKIQSLNNAKLIAELHSDTFNSVQGTVKFDSTGKNTLALPYLFQWRQGSLIPVYPPFVAAANPQFAKQLWA